VIVSLFIRHFDVELLHRHLGVFKLTLAVLEKVVGRGWLGEVRLKKVILVHLGFQIKNT
jgi:hypothetical protein